MNYSSFPESVDQFAKKYHLQASDIDNMKEWKSLKAKTNRTIEEDDRLTNLTGSLKYALIDPEEWNKFQDALTNTQEFFLDEVYVYIQEKQREFDAELDKFNHKGEYNPSTQYRKRNTITYQGESYLCLKDCIGIPPNPEENTEYWAKIAQRGAKGERGIAGVGLRFKGQYNPSAYYYVDDAVQFGGNLYGRLKEGIGQEPNLSEDTEYWSLALSKGSATGTVEFKRTYRLTDETVNIPIGISEYNSINDVLVVIKNTVTLTEDVHYKINANGSSIDSLNGSWDGTTEPILFEFKVLKNYLINPVYADGTMIQDGSIGKEKLNSDLQDEIDEKATQIDLGNLNLGDRGFLDGAKYINGMDLNDITDTGFYYGSSMANEPIDMHMWIIRVVSIPTKDVVYQEAMDMVYPDERIKYVRRRFNDVWTPWEKEVSRKEFAAHKAERATLTELGHVKAETDSEGFLMLPKVEVDDETVFLNAGGEITTINPNADDHSGSPGSTILIAGTMQAGFFGIVPASELWLGGELASEVGITAGTPHNNTVDWLKFAYEGKILFRPMTTIRFSVSWDQINAVGCAYGTKTVTKNGLTYKVRLMRGALTDPAAYTDSDKGAKGSEWNRLMLPIHINAATKAWEHPDNVEADIPNWGIGFTDSELLQSGTGNGRLSWCQERIAGDSTSRMRRGGNGISHAQSIASSGAVNHTGWAPVLELIS